MLELRYCNLATGRAPKYKESPIPHVEVKRPIGHFLLCIKPGETIVLDVFINFSLSEGSTLIFHASPAMMRKGIHVRGDINSKSYSQPCLLHLTNTGKSTKFVDYGEAVAWGVPIDGRPFEVFECLTTLDMQFRSKFNNKRYEDR